METPKEFRGQGPVTTEYRGKGLTFVELLVVILILAALILIALPRYLDAVYRSRVSGCQAQITIINTAAQAFFATNKRWPAEVEEMCESTAPPTVKSPPIQELPECPFGVPYELVPVLQDGTIGGSPTPANPQVGVTVNAADHFDGPWKTALEHR